MINTSWVTQHWTLYFLLRFLTAMQLIRNFFFRSTVLLDVAGVWSAEQIRDTQIAVSMAAILS